MVAWITKILRHISEIIGWIDIAGNVGMNTPLAAKLAINIVILSGFSFSVYYGSKRGILWLKDNGYSGHDIGFYVLKGLAYCSLALFVILMWKNGFEVNPMLSSGSFVSCVILWLSYLGIRGFPKKRSVEDRNMDLDGLWSLVKALLFFVFVIGALWGLGELILYLRQNKP